MDERKEFDPSRYLTKVSGADYLEVKWRLVWLREVDPDATIETELVSHADKMAIFRATVSLSKPHTFSDGTAVKGRGGSATGYGSETPNDFRDYVEKAETKAVGRALAMLGFGTQFAHELGGEVEAGRIVDSPVDFASPRGRRMTSDGGGDGRKAPVLGEPATPKQLKFIQAIARERGISEPELHEEAMSLYGAEVVDLSRRDASAFIERLQARPDQPPPPRDRSTTVNTVPDGAVRDQTVRNQDGSVRLPDAPGRANTGAQGSEQGVVNTDDPATPRQIDYIRGLAKKIGMQKMDDQGDWHTDEAAVASVVGVDFGEDWPAITRGTASTIIENWKQEAEAKKGGS